MENLNVLIDEEKLNNRIKEIAKQISEDYKNEEIVLVCILKGAVYFVADLSRLITDSNVILDFMLMFILLLCLF